MRLAILYSYTILAYALLYPFTFFIVLLVLLFNNVGLKKTIPGLMRFWARSSFILVGKKLQIEGLENLNKSRKYIIMANHSSLFDVMGMVAICPKIAFFGRANLMDIPLFGKVLEAVNYIPMKSADLKNTKYMIEQLVRSTENQTVAIFPEGTRTINGQMNGFRKGFLHVLKASKLDILPISLIGFYDFKPKNRFYFNYSIKLSAKIHPSISFSELENRDDKEIIDRVHSTIQSALNNTNNTEL
jgi:1-acyl-sn-glycerol-3-phosphate acyltransferase